MTSQTPEEPWEGFIDEAKREAEAIEGSAVVMMWSQAWEEGDGINANFIMSALDLGMALFMDKPILVMRIPGQPIGRRVEQVADRIVADRIIVGLPGDPGLGDRIKAAFDDVAASKETAEPDPVPFDQWRADCDALFMAMEYGNPPGGWSDPKRIKDFRDRIADIERRLREH